MPEKKITLGQAIDQIIDALEGLDEAERQTAINATCGHMGLSSIVTSNIRQQHTPIATENNTITSATNPSQHSGKKIDIKSFKEQKSPKSAPQMACVVAYYLQELAPENERKETVNAQDLGKYFKQAKFKLPNNIPQLLRDSKASGYFDSAADRGEYTLNAVGYNLVAHNLPKGSSE